MRLHWCILIAAFAIEASLQLGAAANEQSKPAAVEGEIGKVTRNEVHETIKQTKTKKPPRIRRKIRLLESPPQQQHPSIQVSSDGASNNVEVNPNISLQAPAPTTAPVLVPAAEPSVKAEMPTERPEKEEEVEEESKEEAKEGPKEEPKEEVKEEPKEEPIEKPQEQLPDSNILANSGNGALNMFADNNNLKQTILHNSGNHETVHIDGVGNSKSTVIRNTGNSEQQQLELPQPQPQPQLQAPCNHEKVVEHHHHHHEKRPKAKKQKSEYVGQNGPLVQVNINGGGEENSKPKVESTSGESRAAEPLKLADAFLVPVLEQSALMPEPSAPKRQRAGLLDMSPNWLRRKMSLEPEKVALPHFVLVQRSPNGEGLSASPVSFEPLSMPSVIAPVAATSALQQAPLPMPVLVPMPFPMPMPMSPFAMPAGGPMMAPFGAMIGPNRPPMPMPMPMPMSLPPMPTQLGIPAPFQIHADQLPFQHPVEALELRDRGFLPEERLRRLRPSASLLNKQLLKDEPKRIESNEKPTVTIKELVPEEAAPTTTEIPEIITTEKPKEVITWETVRIPRVKRRKVEQKPSSIELHDGRA